MKKEMGFVKKLLMISLPIALQQLFLNLASLLDTLMVGQLDNANVSGVYIANQILFMANLALFGTVEGSTVFFSQFFGIKDKKHMQNCFAFKIMFSMIIAVIEIVIIYTLSRPLSALYSSDPDAINVSVSYLNIVGISLIPYALTICLSSTLREEHHATSPMVITAIGVVVNFIINYVLIFGKFGAPMMKGAGAACGTLMERIVELITLIIFVVVRKPMFIENFLKSFKIEPVLLKQLIVKSLPLFINESLWGMSQSLLTMIFSRTSDLATTALPICQTIYNLLFVVMLGLGNGEGILVGNTVGEGDFDKAQKEAYLSLLTVTCFCILLGGILFIFSGLIVSFYTGVSDDAKELALALIRFNSFYIIISGLSNNLFFLLRAGGKTGIVFLFDFGYCWLIMLPLASLFAFAFKMDFKTMYMAIYSCELLKVALGFTMLISKKWRNNLTEIVKA